MAQAEVVSVGAGCAEFFFGEAFFTGALFAATFFAGAFLTGAFLAGVTVTVLDQMLVPSAVT